jgi:stage II sporulation protein M
MKVRESLALNYSKCWKFLIECRWFFVFTSGLFALTFLIGFAFPVFFRAEIFELIERLILEIEGKNTLEMITFIFLNNLTASFFAMVFGIFLGIFPVITCVVNGYLLGFVAREAVMVEGIFSLWRILPHGIFELPAVIFSIGIGIRFGTRAVGFLGLGDKNKGLGYVFREGLRFFVFVIFPLLVVGGIIEGILIGLST